MKNEIHPDYHDVQVICGCGNKFNTKSTVKGDTIKVEVCNECHPFFSGTQKVVDTQGRADKFRKKYNLN